MFILDASGYGAAYNMPWILHLKGSAFEKQILLNALDFVVKREQPLRTVLRYNKKAGRVEQKILPKDESRNYWELIEHSTDTYESAIQILTEEQGYIFNVRQTPITRINIVRISDSNHLVMVNGHHVNHDAVSYCNLILWNKMLQPHLTL